MWVHSQNSRSLENESSEPRAALFAWFRVPGIYTGHTEENFGPEGLRRADEFRRYLRPRLRKVATEQRQACKGHVLKPGASPKIRSWCRGPGIGEKSAAAFAVTARRCRGGPHPRRQVPEVVENFETSGTVPIAGKRRAHSAEKVQRPNPGPDQWQRPGISPTESARSDSSSCRSADLEAESFTREAALLP
eukprot:s1735_g2.t1